MLSRKELVTLGEVCQFVGGGTPARERPDFYSGDIPWATVKDFKTSTIIDTQEHVTQEAIDRSASNIVEQGTVLLVTRVGLGKVAMAGRRLAINQDVKGLTPREDVLPEYLFWFLVAIAPKIERMGVGATVKGVTLQDVKAIRFPLPNKDVQRRIVDLLSRAENIVRMRREAEKKAKEIIPALFLDMFGDPATNPKGWDVKRVGDIASYTRYGPRFPDRKYAETGAHILRTTDMDTSGNVRWEESPVLPVTQEEVSRFSLRPGTVVVTRTGATIGKIALFRGADRPCIAGAYLIELGTTDDVDPEYLLALLLSDYGQSALTSGSRAVAQPNLNAPTIRAIPLPIPPKAFQSSFAKRVSSFQALCRQQTGAIAVAEAAFQSLLAGIFFDGRAE